LSILTNVYQLPTSSDDIRDNDLHYVDVSFSPQNQIDSYLSSSISTSNPTFNLDDYIGDPRQQYSASYEDLIIQNKIYSSDFVSDYMDYNGFIRLIQFFDNSLFKMIEDFIPTRTNLSTGITINSTILERNKVSYAEITTINEEIFDAVYDAPTITPEYGKLYDSLSGDKKSFFNGELDGSGIDLYNKYFIPSNYNPYLQPSSSFTPTDTNNFIHSDFNILLNNVSSSITSLTRKNLEYKFENTGSLLNRIILSPVQLQDSYESLSSYVNSRHNGITLFSQKYNDYTDGDKSFGKTATIDIFSNRLGLFSEINSNKFFNNKSNIILKYLVDIDGGLTELNQYNNNWVSIQNIFKSDKNLTISLFDNQKLSNQKLLDGIKPLYNSGYNYDAVLYYSKNTELLNFYTPDYKDIDYLEVSFFSNGLISDSSSTYPINNSYYGIINNTLNNIIQNTQLNYTTGSIGGTSTSSLSNYNIPETSNYNLDLNLSFEFTSSNISSSFYSPDGGYITYDMTTYLNPSELDIASPTSSTNIYNEKISYLSCEGKIYTPQFNYGVLDNSTTLTNFKSNNNYKVSFNPSSATATNFIYAGNDDFTANFKITSNNLSKGETFELYWSEYISNNPLRDGTTLYVTVDEDIIKNNPDNSSRMAAFANKIVNEINNISTNDRLVLRSAPSIVNLTPTSLEITFTASMNQTQSGTKSGRFYVNMINLYKTIQADSSLYLSQDIYDVDGNKILDKNTWLYQYISLKDINLETETSSNITSIWNKNPEIELVYKSNSGSLESRYIAQEFPTINDEFRWNFAKFKYFYILPEDIGESYILPSNVENLFDPPLSNITTINPVTSSLLNFTNISNLFLQEDDKLYFTLRESDKYPSNFNYGLIPQSSNISLVKISSNPNVVSIPNDGTGFLSNTSTTTQLVISNRLSNILNKDNIFYEPNRENYISDLFSKYGDIDVFFSLKKDDLLIIKDRNNTTTEYSILDVEYGNNIIITLTSPIPQQILDNILGLRSETLYYEIILLNKKEDETNIIINQTKKDGKTSYGFIIPYNIDPNILKNIDIITKEVKQKLLNE